MLHRRVFDIFACIFTCATQ